MTIPAKSVRSLCWDGDDLVDWVDGGQRYRLDGTVVARRFGYAYRFDLAAVSPDGRYAVIYEKLGTKGLLLKDAELLREINRSYYCADVYDYPVTLFALPDGRNVMAHCPEEYNRIEIDDIETGGRLTARDSEPMDFFHSRLQATPDGKHLLSAGWFWHPYDAVLLYDVLACLHDPSVLDSHGDDLGDAGCEMHNAVFAGNSRIVFSGSNVDASPGPEKIVLQDIRVDSDGQGQRSTAQFAEIAGRLMPVGDFSLGFYGHPKLIENATGEVSLRWPELLTGTQNSSIHREKTPPLALDAFNKRFAVADKEKITVIELG